MRRRPATIPKKTTDQAIEELRAEVVFLRLLVRDTRRQLGITDFGERLRSGDDSPGPKGEDDQSQRDK
jgi:phage gp36-like protein